MPRRILPLALFGVVLLTTSVVTAQRHHLHRRPPVPRPPPVQVTMQLEDEAGHNLETFHQGGQSWVLGRHGQRYNIRVRNHSARRVEVVVSVDGRDSVSGQVTDLVRHRGYVIPAHGSVRLQGFRKSMSSVAAFRFTNPGNSYSSRLGTPHRVGHISLAAYPERVAVLDRPIIVPEPPPWQRGEAPSAGKRSTNRTPRPAPQHAAPDRAGDVFHQQERAYRRPPRPRNNLGTEYGETRHSRVMQTSFERESRHRPAQRISIRYDDEAGLRSRGILEPPRPHPHPLPIISEPRQFAPPPPRYHGWYCDEGYGCTYRSSVHVH